MTPPAVAPRRRARFIRRAPRLTRILVAVPRRERPTLPSAGRHARLFVLALALVVLIGALLLWTPLAARDGEATAPVDALFTAVSAACLTGLVTVDTRDHWNGFGQAVILLLMQLGGLGFMVGASLLLRMLLSSGRSLHETLLLRDGQPTLSLREARELSMRIVRYTFVVEGTGALLLAAHFWRDMPLPDALWHGLFHAVSAFCNASFDLQGGFRSLTPYQTDVWVSLTIMALVQLGAISWIVMSDVLRVRRWSRLMLETKLVLLVNLAAVLFGTVLFLGVEWSGAMEGTPAWAKPLVAAFQSVAARSGGFATINWGEASSVTQFAWVSLMFVGGASGSTAGGVKLATVGIVVVAVLSALRGQPEPQVFGRRVQALLIYRAMAVIVLLATALLATTLLLALVERLAAPAGVQRPPFLAYLFECMSALATDGVSTGITPSLSTGGKLVLCAAMCFGRLGPLTAVYALQRRQARATRYRFPEEPVRIG